MATSSLKEKALLIVLSSLTMVSIKFLYAYIMQRLAKQKDDDERAYTGEEEISDLLCKPNLFTLNRDRLVKPTFIYSFIDS